MKLLLTEKESKLVYGISLLLPHDSSNVSFGSMINSKSIKSTEEDYSELFMADQTFAKPVGGKYKTVTWFQIVMSVLLILWILCMSFVCSPFCKPFYYSELMLTGNRAERNASNWLREGTELVNEHEQRKVFIGDDKPKVNESLTCPLHGNPSDGFVLTDISTDILQISNENKTLLEQYFAVNYENHRYHEKKLVEERKKKGIYVYVIDELRDLWESMNLKQPFPLFPIVHTTFSDAFINYRKQYEHDGGEKKNYLGGGGLIT